MAGSRARRLLKKTGREPDYYATSADVGPGRLAEMTLESAFYTRHLYGQLRIWIWGMVIAAVVAAIIIVSLALTRIIPDQMDTLIAQVLYTFIPVLISVNLLGWGFRLNRSIGSILHIETDIHRLLGSGEVSETRVVRLISEYDCQLVSGIPIHNWLFSRWHKDIDDLWNQSLSESGKS